MDMDHVMEQAMANVSGCKSLTVRATVLIRSWRFVLFLEEF
jgi:hypothetical protein